MSLHPSNLDELVKMINAEMGQDGLENANVQRIMTIMENYKSNSADYGKYAMFNNGRYTRNLVDDGNGKYNLMILCWDTNQKSPIHDHANSHCIVKLLDGEITETLYDWPESTAPMKITKESTYHTDQVTYMHDKIGLHRMSNKSVTKPAISLHLYSPPYQQCKTFCEENGTARASGICTFYSVKGVKENYIEEIWKKLDLDSEKSKQLDLEYQKLKVLKSAEVEEEPVSFAARKCDDQRHFT